LKQAKLDVTRKDQVLREYIDRLESAQDGQKASKEFAAEVDKLKDL